MSPAILRRAFSLTLLLSLPLLAQAQVTSPDLPAIAVADPAAAAAFTAAPTVSGPAPSSAVPSGAAPSSAGPEGSQGASAAPTSGFTPASTPAPPTLPAPVTPPVLGTPPATPAAPVSPTAPAVAPAIVTPPAPTSPVPTSPVPTSPVLVAPISPAAPPPMAALPSLPPVTLRGLWVDAFGAGLKTQQQVTQTVEDAAKLGVNTLFVQAIRRGDCLCMKSGMPIITDRDLEKGFDPLATITKLAHAKGMRVIAWASVTGIANVASPNTSPQHVMKTHGPNSKDSWLARRSDGTWQEGSDGWLDAGIPAAAEYAAEAVVNLVRNYAVDGVQLDRIRYPDGGNWGYDPATLARFAAETGAKAKPLPTDPAWQQWKRDQVTALVRRIALEVKSVRPSAWMTAATITYGPPPRPLEPGSFGRSQPYNEVLQDWPKWIYEGLIDLNVPMNYKRDAVGDQGAWYNGWNSYASSVRTRADGLISPLAIGSALYLNSPEVSASQASRSVQAGFGWVGYSYRVPMLDVYQNKQTAAQGLETIRRILTLPGGALATPQRWKETPPSSRGLLGRIVGPKWPGNRSVEAWQGGKLIATSLSDGNGYYGFLTLPAGKTEVRVTGSRWTDIIPERGVVHVPDLLIR